MGSRIHVCFIPPAQGTLFIEAIQLFFYRVGVAKLSPYTRLVYQNQCEAQNGHNWQDAAFGPQIFLLELEMAMWKLKLAIWKLNMALGKLQMAIWKLKMAIRKLKNEHFEAKNGQNWQNAGFGPQIVQNGSPQF